MLSSLLPAFPVSKSLLSNMWSPVHLCLPENHVTTKRPWGFHFLSSCQSSVTSLLTRSLLKKNQPRLFFHFISYCLVDVISSQSSQLLPGAVLSVVWHLNLRQTSKWEQIIAGEVDRSPEASSSAAPWLVWPSILGDFRIILTGSTFEFTILLPSPLLHQWSRSFSVPISYPNSSLNITKYYVIFEYSQNVLITPHLWLLPLPKTFFF